jgi:hypothetical protein
MSQNLSVDLIYITNNYLDGIGQWKPRAIHTALAMGSKITGQIINYRQLGETTPAADIQIADVHY